MAFGGHERAGPHADHSDPGSKLSRLASKFAHALVVTRETEVIPRGPTLASLSSFSADVPASLRQVKNIRPAGPTLSPGRVRSTASRNGVSSSTRPACFAVAAAAANASRCRQAPAPPLLPADHRIERADGSAGNERHVLNIFSCTALRIGDGPAQPGRHRCHRCDRRGAAKHDMARQRGFGAQNHRKAQ